MNLQLLDLASISATSFNSPGRLIDSSDYFTLSISSPAVDAFRAENMELGEVRGPG